MKRKAYFNVAAATWDRTFITPELTAFLARFVATFGLQPGQRVLDVGTGTGVLLPFLLDAIGPTGTITAIDYSEQMIGVCRSKFTHLPNVTIDLQDVEALDLPFESYDVVTCFGVFPHIQDRTRALNHLHRVLTPGGRLIIAHALSRAALATHHAEASLDVTGDVLPPTSEMVRLLRDAGFIDIGIADQPSCYLCFANKPRCDETEPR